MTGEQGRILVVDDEESVRDLLQRVLKEAGYNVVTAANGQEALDKMSELSIGVVLLDIKMPGLDGFQVLDHIRQRSDIPVIMLTAIGEVTNVRDSLALGADDYIRKPFKTRELLARIQAKLRRAETAS
ncbi:unnamed protein product [marine sediment metagenome]|uniref:Response regulatory domain-containing protein n=1 Tax=marine sediment metagenome TaxID=412755 RepID=X0ZR28_9ZZZZ